MILLFLPILARAAVLSASVSSASSSAGALAALPAGVASVGQVMAPSPFVTHSSGPGPL